MQIQELSQLTGISSTTIRYYEKVGVLPRPQKSKNGYRTYPKSHILQLKMIAQAKALGFTLKEIKELSSLLFSKKLSRQEMARRLDKKNREIDLKIKALKKMKTEIDNALAGLCEFKERLT